MCIHTSCTGKPVHSISPAHSFPPPPHPAFPAGNYLIGEAFNDYCPKLTGYSNGDCRAAGNAPTTNYFGQVYGSNSQCFVQTLMSTSYVADGVTRAGCYSVTCNGNGDNATYTLATGTSSATCTYTGQVRSP